MYDKVYFIGIGGIGMSAIARYYKAKGLEVSGYDRTPSDLTRALEAEGMDIHYEPMPERIPEDKEHCLVVYTPAIPQDMPELEYVREKGYRLLKRSRTLGEIAKGQRCLAVAGTHGKTTTSTLLAHIYKDSGAGCSAFLGGISKNYDTNLLISDNPVIVAEADEFDRSFHQLRPYATVITAADADHLDIYGTVEAYKESFAHYTSLVQQGGALIVARGVEIDERLQAGVRRYDYGRHEGDFHAENLRIGGGRITFDLVSPLGNIEGVELGVPVSINIDNGIAAMALAQVAGATADEIREAMATFAGVDRRFDFQIKTDRLVFLSDYAHHPEEIRQSILSLREVFDGRKITAIFQPHLYTRTRDFYREFAEALSLLDEVILTEIYPARELPIEGVSSQLIYDALRPDMEKQLCQKKDVQAILRQGHYDVLVVLGAGDLDNQVPAIKQLLLEQQ